ncbi:hypothetical protein [Lactobacillus johnsonii]|uniref:Uncharacterized protein n=1 Tax=Lactobacillus johnsonii TaxID=33959 RepID=A0A9X7TAW2_LACJH|nr:hypothetical protein [Lactobacillus johnsonii]QIA88498.1 hypothetical protein FEE39_09630 [Lactobacillus johnsonii]
MEKEELKNEVQNIMQSELYRKANKAFEEYVDKTGISPRYLNQSAPILVANDTLNDAVDDFMKQVDPVQDTLREQIQDYLNEEYPIGYLSSEIDRRQNEEEIRSEMTDELLLLLDNTLPYAAADTEALAPYWGRGIAKIHSLSEFAKYLNEDRIDSFVEKYCPDWKEVTQ